MEVYLSLRILTLEEGRGGGEKGGRAGKGEGREGEDGREREEGKGSRGEREGLTTFHGLDCNKFIVILCFVDDTKFTCVRKINPISQQALVLPSHLHPGTGPYQPHPYNPAYTRPPGA
jgi:hypothetical protein